MLFHLIVFIEITLVCLVVQRQCVLALRGLGPSFVCVCGWTWDDPEVRGRAPAFLHLLCKTSGCAVFTVVSWGAAAGECAGKPYRQTGERSVMHSYQTRLQYSMCGLHVSLFKSPQWNVAFFGYVSLLCDLYLARNHFQALSQRFPTSDD